MYSRHRNEEFYQGFSPFAGGSSKPKADVVLEIKAKSERVHNVGDDAGDNAPRNAKTPKKNGKLELGKIFSNFSSGNAGASAKKKGGKVGGRSKARVAANIPLEMKNILREIKKGDKSKKKSVKAAQDAGRCVGFERQAKGGRHANIARLMTNEQDRLMEFGFSKSYLEFIGVRQAKWHNERLAKRGKDFMLSIYRGSKCKNIDEVRMRLLFGAFGMRKGIKVRFAL